MDKEELMKIAVECGVTYSAEKWGCDSDGFRTSLHYFAREILERAATVAESEPKVWDLDAPSPQQHIAAKIRAMKG